MARYCHKAFCRKIQSTYAPTPKMAMQDSVWALRKIDHKNRLALSASQEHYGAIDIFSSEKIRPPGYSSSPIPEKRVANYFADTQAGIRNSDHLFHKVPRHRLMQGGFMDSTVLYKGFIIQPLVFQVHQGKRPNGTAYERNYEASVRLICLETDSVTVTKLPSVQPYLNMGDARRGAEMFGRHLIDNPQNPQQ